MPPTDPSAAELEYLEQSRDAAFRAHWQDYMNGLYPRPGGYTGKWIELLLTNLSVYSKNGSKGQNPFNKTYEEMLFARYGYPTDPAEVLHYHRVVEIAERNVCVEQILLMLVTPEFVDNLVKNTGGDYFKHVELPYEIRYGVGDGEAVEPLVELPVQGQPAIEVKADTGHDYPVPAHSAEPVPFAEEKDDQQQVGEVPSPLSAGLSSSSPQLEQSLVLQADSRSSEVAEASRQLAAKDPMIQGSVRDYSLGEKLAEVIEILGAESRVTAQTAEGKAESTKPPRKPHDSSRFEGIDDDSVYIGSLLSSPAAHSEEVPLDALAGAIRRKFPPWSWAALALEALPS